jgi:hypothetical protein
MGYFTPKIPYTLPKNKIQYNLENLSKSKFKNVQKSKKVKKFNKIYLKNSRKNQRESPKILYTCFK